MEDSSWLPAISHLQASATLVNICEASRGSLSVSANRFFFASEAQVNLWYWWTDFQREAYWLWHCSPLNPCCYWMRSMDTCWRNSIKSNSTATSGSWINLPCALRRVWCCVCASAENVNNGTPQWFNERQSSPEAHARACAQVLRPLGHGWEGISALWQRTEKAA